MKAKDIEIMYRDERVKINDLSNNKKCQLIVELLLERDSLKKQVESLTPQPALEEK